MSRHRSPNGYPLQFSKISVSNPLDNTAYYVGLNAVSPFQGVSRIYCPVSGVVRRVYGHFSQVAGSAEQSTLSLMHNGVDVDVISSALLHNAVSTVFSNIVLSREVAAGDYLELRWNTPVWNVNPASIVISATAWIETY